MRSALLAPPLSPRRRISKSGRRTSTSAGWRSRPSITLSASSSTGVGSVQAFARGGSRREHVECDAAAALIGATSVRFRRIGFGAMKIGVPVMPPFFCHVIERG